MTSLHRSMALLLVLICLGILSVFVNNTYSNATVPGSYALGNNLLANFVNTETPGNSRIDATVMLATACTATIDGNFSLHIPELSFNALLYWADFVYEYIPELPTLISFKLTNPHARGGHNEG